VEQCQRQHRRPRAPLDHQEEGSGDEGQNKAALHDEAGEAQCVNLDHRANKAEQRENR
jgi:hypothetical protein